MQIEKKSFLVIYVSNFQTMASVYFDGSGGGGGGGR